jgi:hypothetical protein
MSQLKYKSTIKVFRACQHILCCMVGVYLHFTGSSGSRLDLVVADPVFEAKPATNLLPVLPYLLPLTVTGSTGSRQTNFLSKEFGGSKNGFNGSNFEFSGSLLVADMNLTNKSMNLIIPVQPYRTIEGLC